MALATEIKNFVSIGKGLKIYYEVKGDGEPIILIHGTPTSAFLWRKIIDELSSAYYRVYAIDLPGWARSGAPNNFDYKLESYATAIRQFLDKVGIDKVTLGVHDLGAAVGLTFLARYPELVSRLVIMDTFAYLPFTKRLQWKAGYQFFLKIPVAGSLLHRIIWYLSVKRSDVFATLAFRNKKLATKELIQRYRELAVDSERADFKTFTVNGMDSIWGAVERNSPNVNIPTLIVWAENDVLFPVSAAQRLHQNIAGSVLKIVPDCGHWLQEEKPHEVSRHILKFLQHDYPTTLVQRENKSSNGMVTMKDASYWKEHYIYETDADEIERNIKLAHFISRGRSFELLYFEKGKSAPNILFVTATGDHAYVYAELGCHVHLQGYNVFVMPSLGDDFTINEIIERCEDAAGYISNDFNRRIGVIGGSLGGMITFNLGLSGGPVKSMICQDPGILSEKGFREALLDRGAGRKGKKLIPLGRLLLKIWPGIKIPITSYLDFSILPDSEEERHKLDAYMKDPDIMHSYTVSACMSQITTPPPRPVEDLAIPTMFLVPVRDRAMAVDYLKSLYARLPVDIGKRFLEVDGGHYWMLSHPKLAANAISDWFDETL